MEIKEERSIRVIVSLGPPVAPFWYRNARAAPLVGRRRRWDGKRWGSWSVEGGKHRTGSRGLKHKTPLLSFEIFGGKK